MSRLLLKDPQEGGGEGAGQPQPTHPPTHIKKMFLRQKVKFIKGAGQLRPILGTQTSFLASWGFSFSNGLHVRNVTQGRGGVT